MAEISASFINSGQIAMLLYVPGMCPTMTAGRFSPCLGGEGFKCVPSGEVAACDGSLTSGQNERQADRPRTRISHDGA